MFEKDLLSSWNSTHFTALKKLISESFMLRRPSIARSFRFFSIIWICISIFLLSGCFETFKTSYTEDSRLASRIDAIMKENSDRVKTLQSDKSLVPPSQSKPGKTDAWWQGEVGKSLRDGADHLISLENVYLETIKHSTQIKVFSDIPLIRETGIQEAKGEFDTVSFVEAMYSHTNDPIGSILETGFTTGRFLQNQTTGEAGLKKKIATGAQVKVSEQVGLLSNNSDYLVPSPQGSARLKLTVMQPLLKGAGIAYNRAVIDIAKIDSASAMQEMIRQAESHLLEVARAYWGLYLARSIYLQKYRLYDQAVKVSEEIKARGEVDAVRGQIARANSAMAERRSDLVRAELSISNAQDRIRALVNSPELAEAGAPELIPSDMPLMREYHVDYEKAAKRALAQRPEILQAFLQVRAAAVREKMQRNEVLPTLNAVLEGYIAGLGANGNTGAAWNNQFTQGGPGIAAGFQFEFPLENQTADARYKRRLIEMRQQVNQLKTTIETTLLEIKVTAREVRTAWRDYSAKMESMVASKADLAQFQARREVETPLPGEPQQASAVSNEATTAYLDSILSAQNRLTISEEEFAKTATAYQLAILNFERAQGNLLNYQDVTIVRTTENDKRKLPILKLQKGQVSPNSKESK